MSRPRLTVGASMAVVAALAAGLAVLKNPTGLRTSLTFTLTVLALLTGLLGSLFRRGRGRALWTGFTLFGGAYFLFGPVAACSPGLAPELYKALPDRLLTIRPVNDLANVLYGFDDPVLATLNGVARRVYVKRRLEDSKNFVTIAHSLLTLVAGLLGAGIGFVVAPRDPSPA